QWPANETARLRLNVPTRRDQGPTSAVPAPRMPPSWLENSIYAKESTPRRLRHLLKPSRIAPRPMLTRGGLRPIEAWPRETNKRHGDLPPRNPGQLCSEVELGSEVSWWTALHQWMTRRPVRVTPGPLDSPRLCGGSDCPAGSRWLRADSEWHRQPD